jgi:hypothetical protein
MLYIAHFHWSQEFYTDEEILIPFVSLFSSPIQASECGIYF